MHDPAEHCRCSNCTNPFDLAINQLRTCDFKTASIQSLGYLHMHQLSQMLAHRGLGTADQLSKATEQLGKFLGPDLRPDLLVGLQNCHHKRCSYGLQGQYLAYLECHTAV